MTRSYERSKRWSGEDSGTADRASLIPDDKKYFRIGEVSRIVGVEPYVLRYWESEFSQVRPARADSNQRTYQKNDLELLLEIKHLLYEEKLTIEGARNRLRSQRRPEKTQGSEPFLDLDELRRHLNEILRLLS
ncbi:MAG: MerR family transcriptional regulator [Thermodesulfobacteriota bacterium]